LLTTFNLSVRRPNLGEIFGSRLPMRLKPGTLPESDILFVSRKRLHLIKETFREGSVDFIMRSSSRGTRRHTDELEVLKEIEKARR